MRRPVHPIRLCLLLLLACILGLTAFIASFRLDDYRAEIAFTLSETLRQPVRVEDLRLTLSPRPALSCGELEIGRPGGLHLQAKRLLLELSLPPLLDKQIVWHAIRIEQPQITLPSPGEGAAAASFKLAALPGLLNELQIADLSLVDGDLQFGSVEDSRPPVRLKQFNMEANQTAKDRSTEFTLSGRLAQGSPAANLLLTGRLDNRLAAGPAIELHLNLAGLATSVWLAASGIRAPSLTGLVDLDLQLEGNLSNGFDWGLDADLHRLSYRKTKDLSRAIPRLHASGHWSREADLDRLGAIDLQAGPLRLKGDLAWDRTEQAIQAEGSLKTELPTLAKALARTFPALNILARLERGSADFHSWKLDLPLARPATLPGLLKAFQTDLVLNGLRLPIADRPLRIDSASASFNGGRLRLQKLEGSYRETAFVGTGDLDLVKKQPTLAFDLSGQPEAALLSGALAPDFHLPFPLSGSLPLQVRLSGLLATPHFTLRADLDPLAVGPNTWLQKEAGDPGRFTVSGHIEAGQPRLTSAELRLSPYNLQAQGAWQLSSSGAFIGDLELAPVDLRAVSGRSPILTSLNPRGKIGLAYHLEGDRSGLQKHYGRLKLVDVGLHLTNVIADLNNISGTLLLSEDGARALPLKGQLGQSTIALNGSYTSEQGAPQIKLRIQGKSITANELIFNSPNAKLLDLDGRLGIDTHGITFEKVTVALAGGTRAEVRGRMEGWAGAHVGLTIDAEYGNIDEVIALWTDRPNETDEQHPAPPKEKEGKPVTVVIDIRSAAGHIGRLNFTKADTLLTHNGRGLMILHPIRFHHQSGYGIAQVIADSRGSARTRLRISGHLENFPAATIHHDLLQRKSLISGRLRGDFHLEGNAGKDFLATSFGGFAVDIQRGVLRRFPTLSKVFSLLNVSQLLTFDLPDMAESGMPFDLIHASLRLNEGILQTDDLWIKSEAMDMSLVGSLDLNEDRIDAMLGVKPLRTADKIVTSLPIAGWLLGGEEKALITAHFRMHGPSQNPQVDAIPAKTISSKVMDIFQRVLALPGKMVTHPEEVIVPPAVQPE